MADAVRIESTGPDVTGPRIVSSSASGNVVGPIDRLTVTFSEAINAGTFTTDDVIIGLPGGGTLAPTQVNDQGGNTFEILFASQSALGGYSLTVGPAIEDTSGNLMDQDSDSTPGETPDDQFTSNFTLIDPPVISDIIIDDGDVGFSQTGFQYIATPILPGYEVDWHRKRAGTGAGTATWTFTDLAPGDYQVSATWAEKANRATDAPFTVFDGNTSLGTVQLNQRLAPDDLNTADDGGTDWEHLGVFTVTGSTLVVQLNESPGGTGQVMADAVRIEMVN